MRNKLILFGVTLVAAATFGIFQLSAKAAVDTTPDCDKYAIVWCGTKNEAEFHARFNNDNHHKDHAKVFAAFGISKADVSGMKYGVVWRNGNVTIDDKIVATNARNGARNLGGTPIAGTTAAVTSTSVFGSEGQRAMIKMVNGVFKFAIITSCGNPITATPKLPPVPPKPPVVPTGVCEKLTVTRVSRTEAKFAASAKVTNGGKVIAYNYYFGDGKKLTTPAPTATYTYPDTAKTYTPTLTVTIQLGNVTKEVPGPNCKGTFTVTPLSPAYSCDKLTVTKINRTNFKFDTAYTVKNATFKSVAYVVRNATTGKEIARTNSPLYEQKTDGKYTVESYVTVTITATGKDQTTKFTENCKKPFEVEKEPETPAAVCDGLTVDKISGTELTRTFTGGASVSGGATILGYELEYGDDTKDTINNTSEKVTATHVYKEAKEYTAQLYVKVKLNNKEDKITSNTCKVKFTISPKVCEAPDGNTYPEGDERCAPCPVPGKEHLPKGADCYDCTTPGHENDAECVETPVELPKTGMADNILALFGAGSLIAAVGYYVASRRALIG